MRYIYDRAGDRVGLGFKRAIMVAVFYTGSMAACALAIALCADTAARQAVQMIVPNLIPPAETDSTSNQHEASAAKSNAAIIASAEARQAATKKIPIKAPAGRSPVASSSKL